MNCILLEDTIARLQNKISAEREEKVCSAFQNFVIKLGLVDRSLKFSQKFFKNSHTHYESLKEQFHSRKSSSCVSLTYFSVQTFYPQTFASVTRYVIINSKIIEMLTSNNPHVENRSTWNYI